MTRLLGAAPCPPCPHEGPPAAGRLPPHRAPGSRVLQLASRLVAHVPSQCAICYGWAGGRICTACSLCFTRSRPRCSRCALEVPAGTAVCGACVTAPPAFDHVLATVDYAFPWDKLILQFKFSGSIDLAPALSALMLGACQQSPLPLPELLLPVPLSAHRLRERGFNQAWELARRLGRALSVPSEPGLLQRVRDTPHQLALPVERRTANVQGAFALDPRRSARLQGRHVAVVDDVMTTGATSTEVARLLRGAGAASIGIWVVARTPKR